MERVLLPKEVATKLGISESMLRRYSLAYETLYGTIPRDNRHGRLYSEETVNFMVIVRDHIKEGMSLSEAMRTLPHREVNTPTGTVSDVDPSLQKLWKVLEHQTNLLEEQSRRIDLLQLTLDKIPSNSSLESPKSTFKEDTTILQRFFRNWLGFD